MNERIEKITPISRIHSVRKIVLQRPNRDGREAMYQFSRYPKANKKKISKTEPHKSMGHQTTAKISSDVISEEVKDIKKRLAFDRAMIIGDES